MTRRALMASVYRDCRALLPLWTACAAGIAAGALLRGSSLQTLSVFAYGAGSVAIGAHVIGHEYAHRTLGALLVQPGDRRRVFLMKLVVVAALLATLGFAAFWTVRDAGELRTSWLGNVFLLIGLCGLFLAPCMTMLGRSTIAGVVFTIAIPGIVATGADLTALAKLGSGDPAAVDVLARRVFWPVMFGVCAFASLASWRLFTRLEAIDGRGAEIHMPACWSRSTSPSVSASPTRRHPLWRLASRELHAHQMAFVLAGLYPLAIAALALRRLYDSDVSTDAVVAVTSVYTGTLAMLVGAMASAEERQLGTHEWQLLLPIASWKQWMVKVIVSVSLGLGLAVALPAAVVYPLPLRGEVNWIATSAVVVILTTCSLYVSSMSSSGIRALLVSVPAIAGAFVFTHWVGVATAWVTRDIRRLRLFAGFEWVLFCLLASFVVGLLLWMAHWNHRSGDRSFHGVMGQVVSLAAALAVVVMLLEVAGF